MLEILLGIENPENLLYFLYVTGALLVLLLVYRRLLNKVWFYEKEMDRLYRELWTKIKSESADPDTSMIVVNSRINHMKEEYAEKIDHLETKRDFLLKRVPLIGLGYNKKRQKDREKLASINS